MVSRPSGIYAMTDKVQTVQPMAQKKMNSSRPISKEKEKEEGFNQLQVTIIFLCQFLRDKNKCCTIWIHKLYVEFHIKLFNYAKMRAD